MGKSLPLYKITLFPQYVESDRGGPDYSQAAYVQSDRLCRELDVESDRMCGEEDEGFSHHSTENIYDNI